jgi:Ca2+-binding RTX toxin-like protein
MPTIRGNDRPNKLVGISDTFGVQNLILGLGGNDTLEGGFYSDSTIYGGEGDDSITGGAGRNALFGEGGNDHIEASRGYSTLYGGAGRDDISGGLYEGITLDGGAGADTMTGGKYGDTYYVDNVLDVVREYRKPEYDTEYDPRDILYTSIGLDDNDYFEVVYLTGRADLSAVGNADINNLVGNRGDNILRAGGGDDFISGMEGVDSLFGGKGADFFQYFNKTNSGDADLIYDFRPADDSLLFSSAHFETAQLWTPLKSEFRRGDQAQDANDRFIYDRGSGRLLFDADGNGSQESILIATFINSPRLTASDIEIN